MLAIRGTSGDSAKRDLVDTATGSLAIGVMLSLAACADAKALLDRLGLPEGAADVSPVDVDGPDGNMPEIATRSFRVRGDATALSRFYFERCQQVGYLKPNHKPCSSSRWHCARRRGGAKLKRYRSSATATAKPAGSS